MPGIDNAVRRIKDWTGTGINPATEDTLDSIVTELQNNILDSPTTKSAVSITAVATSHTITAGKKNLVIQA